MCTPLLCLSSLLFLPPTSLVLASPLFQLAPLPLCVCLPLDMCAASPSPCFVPLPFRFASPCCAASPKFLFLFAVRSPFLPLLLVCSHFLRVFSFPPLSFLCVASPVGFASPFEKCLYVCRVSSSCFTSPLCADAAPCAALDLNSTDNHRDDIEGRTLMVQLVRRMQVTHHDSCACVVFKPSLEPQLLSCRV